MVPVLPLLHSVRKCPIQFDRNHRSLLKKGLDVAVSPYSRFLLEAIEKAGFVFDLSHPYLVEGGLGS